LNKDLLPYLHIALPVLNEAELLPRLLECLLHQDYDRFRLYVCVNQPGEWWEDPEKRKICETNAETLQLLQHFNEFEIKVIDRTTPGNGWTGKKHGVGWARKTAMDEACMHAGGNDIMVSLDADTTFGDTYLSSLAENFAAHPDAVALAVPYFHKLTADKNIDRAILRYEIYMRCYSLNLWRIGSPYSFTALGSAMACPVWAYRAVGGMTPKMSGEDFYFLQKLRKYGKMLFHNEEKVYPEARFSDRVYFGTGPAMIRGNNGDWSGYPVYSFHYFDEIRETTAHFDDYFKETKSTPVVDFIRQQLNEEDPFRLLRENFKETGQFVRACHEKFDGLRILQYLKYRQKDNTFSDEECLLEYLERFYPGTGRDELTTHLKDLSFERSDTEDLDKLRLFLLQKEEEYQANSVPSLPGQQLP
jgi:hypothetical protein